MRAPRWGDKLHQLAFPGGLRTFGLPGGCAKEQRNGNGDEDELLAAVLEEEEFHFPFRWLN